MRSRGTLVTVGRLACVAVAAILMAAPAPSTAAPRCLGKPLTQAPGGPGDNLINGTSGPDVLAGGGGDDTINGLGGNDRLCGDGGADHFEGGEADDRLSGGPGRDLADYYNALGPVEVDLGERRATGAGDDALRSIEDASGGYLDDLLIGDRGRNELRGIVGEDELRGGQGDDSLFEYPSTSPADRDDALAGGAGDDVLAGSNGLDTLTGGPGADEIMPETTINTSNYGSCDGSHVANDDVDGGGGQDTVNYWPCPAGVTVDLEADSATGLGSDTVADTEHAVGSEGASTLRGDDHPNELTGQSLNDLLQGRGDDDALDAGAGPDNLQGGPGHDRALGRGGPDTFAGGPGRDVQSGGEDGDTFEAAPSEAAGADRLRGGNGNDQFTLHASGGHDEVNGGPASDTLFFSSVPTGIDLDLLAGTIEGGAEGSVTGVEIAYGTIHDDELRGNDPRNEFYAGPGDDLLDGRSGDDLLIGDEGADTLIGGPGDDDCDFVAATGDTADSCDPI